MIHRRIRTCSQPRRRRKRERQRLFRIIEELVQWENTTNEAVLKQARRRSGRAGGAPARRTRTTRAQASFSTATSYPRFTILSRAAGRATGSAAAWTRGLRERPEPRRRADLQGDDRDPAEVRRRPPVNPESRKGELLDSEWRGAQGLAEDVRYYGQWMRDEAEKRIGHLYPEVEVTAEMAKERPDLKPFVGRKLTVIAWLWARTVKSPNPAFAKVDVPLASTFMLSTKPGKEAYIEPVIEGGGYRFTVKMGKPKDAEMAKNGTKLARGANFRCLMSGAPISGDYIKAEGKAGRMGARMMAIVAEGRARASLPGADDGDEGARAKRSRSGNQMPSFRESPQLPRRCIRHEELG